MRSGADRSPSGRACPTFGSVVTASLRRAFAYAWAAPTTLLGVCLCPLAGSARVRGGVLELHGRGLSALLRRLPAGPRGAAALTLGHVVVGRDQAALDACRTHEAVHVRQCERWGPLFVPAYLSASLWALLSGRDPYHDNMFEREAVARTSFQEPS